MILRSRGLRLALGLVLAALLPSCGGGTGPDPVSTPVPTPTLAPFVLLQSTFPPLDPGEIAIGDFTISAPGTLRATLEWTFATNRMGLIIFSGTTCTVDDFTDLIEQNLSASAACTPLGANINPSVKPAVITINVTQPQGARVDIVNLGPTGESGTILITLQR